jgi:DNA replication ATP-dependent helicase Dna2
MFEPLCIGPILLAKKFIMFGDYYTLNPQCKSAEADKRGLTVSLHRRLCERHPT